MECCRRSDLRGFGVLQAGTIAPLQEKAAHDSLGSAHVAFLGLRPCVDPRDGTHLRDKRPKTHQRGVRSIPRHLNCARVQVRGEVAPELPIWSDARRSIHTQTQVVVH